MIVQDASHELYALEMKAQSANNSRIDLGREVLKTLPVANQAYSERVRSTDRLTAGRLDS